MGEVYLIHFAEKLHHAQHYLGWSKAPVERLADHKIGKGSRLLNAVRKKGIPFAIVRTWVGDRNLERLLHKKHNSPKMCPICSKTCKVSK